MTSIDLTINVDEVIDAATRLSRIERSLIGATAVKSINKVLPRTYELAERKMLSGIKLDREDFTSQMRVEKATDVLKPEGTIVGDRRTKRPLTMRRFVVGSLLQNVRWSQGFVMSMVAKRMTNPIAPGTTPLKWTVRQGDRSRGVPRGKKIRGIEIEVMKGRPKKLIAGDGKDGWILMPTKNGLLPARAIDPSFKGRGRKLKVIKGPSIWQLFKAQIPGMRGSVLEDLRKTLSADVRDDILGLLK